MLLQHSVSVGVDFALQGKAAEHSCQAQAPENTSFIRVPLLVHLDDESAHQLGAVVLVAHCLQNTKALFWA